mmetsp:Transcript_8091/g.17587  ORF Transcript_8091/g.17587 Transcript_8091/m.17587 type:complete len:108 (-) Transcript_8091:544-867(-)
MTKILMGSLILCIFDGVILHDNIKILKYQQKIFLKILKMSLLQDLLYLLQLTTWTKVFFKPFSDVYDVVFLSDFHDLLSDLNISYYPMVDQIVASKGRIFYGTFYST